MNNLVEVTVPMPNAAAADSAKAALDAAEARQIVTADDYVQAASELQVIKSKAREIDESRKALKRPIDEAAARIQAFFKGPLDFLQSAEAVLKRKLAAYQAEQDRIRLEEQRKADEAARRERERLEERARKAAEAGKVEKAEELQQRASTVVAPMVQREAPKVAGVQTREVWKFEVVDAGEVPRQYLSVDEAKIRKVVGALKGDCKIPGVRIWSEKAIAAGTAA